MLVYVLVIARNMSAVLISHCLMLYSPTRIDIGVSISFGTDKGSRVARYASTQISLYRHAHTHILLYILEYYSCVYNARRHLKLHIVTSSSSYKLSTWLLL
jgi:hypothetical protein